jgi:hypothetical protein
MVAAFVIKGEALMQHFFVKRSCHYKRDGRLGFISEAVSVHFLDHPCVIMRHVPEIEN